MHVHRGLAPAAVAAALLATLLGPPAPAAAVEQTPAVAAARDAAFDEYQSSLKSALDVPMSWNGTVDPCNPGAPSAAAQSATLQALNYLRRLAGLQPVAFDATLSARAQKAALIMHAQDDLSHDPPSSWRCWTQEGRDGAATSNLYLGVTGAAAMTGYMHDPGASNYFVGHRRWILYPPTRTMGSGSTSSANALTVIGGARDDTDKGPGWVPWPTAGHFPTQLEPAGRWSLSAPDQVTDFTAARVSVTRGGVALPVRLEPVNNGGYGNSTLVWQVDLGALAARDQDYAVTVSGIRRGEQQLAHSYAVTLFDAEVDARQTITMSAPTSGVYGDLIRPVATASSGLPVRLSTSTPEVCRAEAAQIRLVGVGQCTVAADQPGDEIRRPAPTVTRSIAVGKRAASVRADDLRRLVGEANPALTVTLEGLAPGESRSTSDITGDPACSTTAEPSSSPGRYAITCTVGTLSSAHYDFTFAAGTLTVEELPPTLSLSPTTVAAGQPTTVTYRGAPGTTLDILSRTQPATVFSKIGTVTLDSNGFGTSTHKPQKNTRITARTSSGRLSEFAPLIAVRSVASFNAQRVGTRTYAFTGRVYPALNNRLVNIYRNGSLVAQARSDATGIYRVTRTLGAGTFTFQARTPNDTYNLGTSSPARSIRIY